MYLGIDLTSFESKPTACAVLDAEGSMVQVARLYADADIVDLASRSRPSIIAIDAPLGLPKGMDCLEESCGCTSEWDFNGRWGERELYRRGIPLYITTKRAIIKPMVYRAMRLKGDLKSPGCEVIEVYPYATKVLLLGKAIPKKTTRAGLEFLKEKLGALVQGLDRYPDGLDHDGYDAVVAGYTAYLHGTGRTESVGSPDEVPIIVPREQ